MPDPTNEGAVHMYTEERLLAEKINEISLSYLTLTPDWKSTFTQIPGYSSTS